MRWNYTRHGRSRKPVSTTELMRLAAAGRLGPHDLLWMEGDDRQNAVPALAAIDFSTLAGAPGLTLEPEELGPKTEMAPGARATALSGPRSGQPAAKTALPPETATSLELDREGSPLVAITCVFCRESIQVPESMFGQTVQCSSCSSVFVARKPKATLVRKRPTTPAKTVHPKKPAPTHVQQPPAPTALAPMAFTDLASPHAEAEPAGSPEEMGYDPDTGQVLDEEKFKLWQQEQQRKTEQEGEATQTIHEIYRNARRELEEWVDRDENREMIVAQGTEEIVHGSSVQEVLLGYQRHGQGFVAKLYRHLEFLVENRRKFYSAFSRG